MFDISGPELLTILLIALIVVGPRRLPELTRKVGGWTTEIRRAVRELRTSLDKDVKAIAEPIQEAAQEIKSLGESVKETTNEVAQSLDRAASDETGGDGKSRYRWVGPQPISGPTPEDAIEDLSDIEEAQHEGESS